MTEYLLSIDPGKSTGIARLAYDDTSVVFEGGWQFSGGARELIHWCDNLTLVKGGYRVIAEKFTARNTQGFSYTTDSLEPLRCEGVLLALGLMPDYTVAEKSWRDPGLQYLVGGKEKADKKKRQHKFLKDSGFYLTGKDLGSPDADDYRSAAAHGIAYLARELKNKAAFKLITDWTDANV